MAVLTSGLGLSRTKLVKDIASLSVKHKTAYMCAESLQLCPALCDPVDCSLPGCSVCGILQARILEWVSTKLSTHQSADLTEHLLFIKLVILAELVLIPRPEFPPVPRLS